MLIVSWFICGVLYFLFYCYTFSELVCNEKFKVNYKIIFFSLLIGVIYSIISKFDLIYLRPYIIHIYFFFVFRFIFKKSFVKVLIGIFTPAVIFFFAETVFGLLFFLLKIDVSGFTNDFFGYIICNLFILLFALVISKINFIKKIFFNIVTWYNENEFKVLVVLVCFALTIVIFILYNNFTRLLPTSLLLFSNLFCIGVFIFVIGFFKEKAQNNHISSEYENLLDYVKVYENAVEEKSKNQHEYKNQLILLKGMLGKTNKKALNYINELLNTDSENEDINWLNKLKYVPQGGLKGLLYYKIQEMLKEEVKIFVDVSPELEKSTNSKIINKLLGDVSKVIGVYIDNSIEAVRELKEKYIVIEFYIESKNIVFSISNNYNGSIYMDKVDKEGYTTKGTGHGYGLSLVRDIIDKNDKLSQKRELNGIYFVQKLYIKK